MFYKNGFSYVCEIVIILTKIYISYVDNTDYSVFGNSERYDELICLL